MKNSWRNRGLLKGREPSNKLKMCREPINQASMTQNNRLLRSNTHFRVRIPSKCRQIVWQSLLLPLRREWLLPIQTKPTKTTGSLCLTSRGWSTATSSQFATAMDSMAGKSLPISKGNSPNTWRKSLNMWSKLTKRQTQRARRTSPWTLTRSVLPLTTPS